MLTEVQQIILTCLLGPEDKTAFRRAKAAARTRAWKDRNPEKARESERATRAKQDPEKVREQKRAWHKKYPLTPGELRQKNKVWKGRPGNRNRHNELNRLSKARLRAANPEKYREEDRAWQMKRRREDPDFRLRSVLRSRICNALRGAHKSAHTEELIGCTVPELRARLGAQFRPGMTWENYGSVWEIDHIRPCASFDLTDPAQQRECFHWSNQQPLTVEENGKKGASY